MALERLLTLLKSAPPECDRFASHLYQSRRDYRQACETAGKSGKQIERCVISSFQVAESMGFKGAFRQWETFCGSEIERGSSPVVCNPPTPARRQCRSQRSVFSYKLSL
jgi:hypothetical protein